MSSSHCKLILLGNGSVGKTSLIARFTQDGFAKTYKQTVGCDFFEKTLEIQGKQVKLAVWDIGGQSLASANLPNYIMKSNVVFLCYDVTDGQSFEDVQDWLTMVERAYVAKNERDRKEAVAVGKKRFKDEPLPSIFLVGNKIDLVQYRKVSEVMHNRFVASSNLTGGFFVSAGNGDNVLTVFYRVAAQINGLVLSAYELEFTKKIVGVAAVDGVDCGANTNNSEGIDEEDKKAHDELMRTMQNGGGGEERCKGCCVT